MEMAGGDQLVTSEPLQLVEMGLYPASWKQPRTAYTITLLESYHLLSLQTHCSAEDFYTYLRRKTDNVAPKAVPVSTGSFASAGCIECCPRIDIAS